MPKLTIHTQSGSTYVVTPKRILMRSATKGTRRLTLIKHYPPVVGECFFAYFRLNGHDNYLRTSPITRIEGV